MSHGNGWKKLINKHISYVSQLAQYSVGIWATEVNNYAWLVLQWIARHWESDWCNSYVCLLSTRIMKNITKGIKMTPVVPICYNNSFAACPFLIKTEIFPCFCLNQGSSTTSNLMKRIKTIQEPCLFQAGPLTLYPTVKGSKWGYLVFDRKRQEPRVSS